MASSTGSLVRQNYHTDNEVGINKQINMELYASYVYASMATYFDRDDVALQGFHKFFQEILGRRTRTRSEIYDVPK